MNTSTQGRPLAGVRAGLLALALAAFAAVTTEMLPVGLLPQIGGALGVSEPTAGLVVSLYAVMVAALAVPLTALTRRVRPRRLLLVAMACYAASSLAVAAAPTFAALAAGRAVGGATHALFFSVCTGYAARLVPADRTGRAIALTQGGASAGFVLGVPLATTLGNAVGWRWAFVALAVLAAGVVALTARVLPEVEPQAAAPRPAGGGRGRMAAVVTANTLVFLGHYALYTYVSVALLRAGAAPGTVGPLLLLFGAAGLVGLAAAARQVDRRLHASALAILALLGAGVLGVGAGLPHLVPVLVAGVVWNGAFAPVATLVGTAAVRTGATTPELAGAWVNATCNVGIALGAAVGGAVLARADVREVAWVAAVPVAAALLVVARSGRAFRAAR